MALQLKVWTKDIARLRGEKTQERNEVEKTREVTKTEAAPTVRENEALKKEVADQKWKIELEAQMAKNSIRDQQDEAMTAEAGKRPRPFACWGCGELGHSLRTCSKNEVEERSVERELAEDSIRVVRGNEVGINLLVGESLPKRQQEDPDVGTIVRRRLMTDEVPTCKELETESESTKKLATKWERL